MIKASSFWNSSNIVIGFKGLNYPWWRGCAQSHTRHRAAWCNRFSRLHQRSDLSGMHTYWTGVFGQRHTTSLIARCKPVAIQRESPMNGLSDGLSAPTMGDAPGQPFPVAAIGNRTADAGGAQHADQPPVHPYLHRAILARASA